MSIGRKTYLLVSPVKDEANYIARTIQSVMQQTVRPAAWVIVDDGSRDRTKEIAEECLKEYPWVTIVSLPTAAKRQPGSGIIRAFNAGYDLVKDQCFDFIVKFDCDIEISRDYFERLIEEFERDEALGIASGIYLEERCGTWVPVKMPDYHAAGQTKMVRYACFEEIGGFVTSRGWDTVDEIRAQVKGWTTRHFKSVQFLHLKKEGSGIGFSRTNIMHGEIFYCTGGSKVFLLFKFLHRLMFGRPAVLGGFLMLWGFIRSWASGKPKLVNRSEEQLYQRLLSDRLFGQFFRASHVRN
jgi:glycosyltransferase involved in cell wall biosynthesis